MEYKDSGFLILSCINRLLIPLSVESKDPFTVHFEQDLDESVEKSLGNLRTWQQKTRKVCNIFTQ